MTSEEYWAALVKAYGEMMIKNIIEIYADHEMYQMHGNGD